MAEALTSGIETRRDWAEYREAMARQNKSPIRVHIDRWGPVATGGFPPDLAD